MFFKYNVEGEIYDEGEGNGPEVFLSETMANDGKYIKVAELEKWISGRETGIDMCSAMPDCVNNKNIQSHYRSQKEELKKLRKQLDLVITPVF